MMPCQACILHPSCNSTLTLNQGDLVLGPDMDYCSTSPEFFFANIELIPSLTEVFKHVPQTNQVFHAYSLSENGHSVLSSVRMELAVLPDVQRLSVDSIDQLASPIKQYYSSISAATSQALESYLRLCTAVLFPTVSIKLSLLTFTMFYSVSPPNGNDLSSIHTSSSGVQMDDSCTSRSDETTKTATDDAAVFIQLSWNEFNALETFASETLRYPPHNTNSYTTCKPPQVPTRAYPGTTSPLYDEYT